ncbi:uncharacterized protein LOC120504972 isoform X1 [Passer montanus]|uniref:uncharacterized protein LOC120504972 isoform X1 n=1 Tax=Passer montanus TaxID=9160 RepID=UPI001960CDC5|nr:uncharacterized protein LOC120504972 isoform X1 [Passer montanus]
MPSIPGRGGTREPPPPVPPARCHRHTRGCCGGAPEPPPQKKPNPKKNPKSFFGKVQKPRQGRAPAEEEEEEEEEGEEGRTGTGSSGRAPAAPQSPAGFGGPPVPPPVPPGAPGAMGIQGMELCAVAVLILLFIAVLKQFGILEPISAEDSIDADVELPSARHHPEELEQLLARTKFTKAELQSLYRGFKSECPGGLVDEETFTLIYSRFFPQGDASSYAHFLFDAFDAGRNGALRFQVGIPGGNGAASSVIHHILPPPPPPPPRPPLPSPAAAGLSGIKIPGSIGAEVPGAARDRGGGRGRGAVRVPPAAPPQDFAVGLSVLLRGTEQQKLRWTFDLYDVNKDGCVSKERARRARPARGAVLPEDGQERGRRGDLRGVPGCVPGGQGHHELHADLPQRALELWANRRQEKRSTWLPGQDQDQDQEDATRAPRARCCHRQPDPFWGAEPPLERPPPPAVQGLARHKPHPGGTPGRGDPQRWDPRVGSPCGSRGWSPQTPTQSTAPAAPAARGGGFVNKQTVTVQG